MPKRDQPHIVWFQDVDRDDGELVGGKGANLGEMTKAGFPVPPGFIVTSPAYFHFLTENHLRGKIKALLSGLDVHNTPELTRISAQIRKLINQAQVPSNLATSIMKAYLKLGLGVPVAVRSSATAEDLPGASFAGQQDTFLNVSGDANVLLKVKDAWSSLFTPRAIFYRSQKHFDHFRVGIAIPVQRMIQSEASGVMFTINPTNNDKSVVVVEAILGLGELIVQGAVTPDHFEVLKRNVTIVSKQINRQTKMMVKVVKDHQVENVVKPVPSNRQSCAKVKDDVVVRVAKMGMKLQQHYFFPQDVEWSVESGRIYIVQTRPITTISEVASAIGVGNEKLATKGLELLVHGEPASPGMVSGPAIVIRSIREIHRVKPGEILIMEMTTPDFVPAMRKVAAIVTDQGGQTSHAAIVSRELGVPAVVGTQIATRKIRTGTVITVNGLTGDVYRGPMKHDTAKHLPPALSAKTFGNITEKPGEIKTATKLYVNLSEPDLAERIAAEDVDGVGLLRAEFMIAQIGIHPKKLINDGKTGEFISQLTDGLTKFAAAFHPRPVVYRATDFRTNEYRNLKGGNLYEPDEPNPMIGYRGAFRYLRDPRIFELELAAIKKVRQKWDNLHLMIPFVRSVQELLDVKKLIYANDIRRSPKFHLWMMAELPINVILIDDFIQAGIDGISIGTNDLTMLTIGTDRDNQEVSELYNEMNPAVIWSLERLIKSANSHGISSSICGQAPSFYPELSQQLVEWGITSISVAPDRIGITRQLIYQAEKKHALKS